MDKSSSIQPTFSWEKDICTLNEDNDVDEQYANIKRHHRGDKRATDIYSFSVKQSANLYP